MAKKTLGCFLEKLIELVFEPEIIRNHRDEFRICRLSTVILNGVAEVTVQRIHVAAVPRDLDGVANGSFNAAGRRLVFLCHRE